MRQDHFLPAMVDAERLKLADGKLYRADELFSILRDIAQDIDPKKVINGRRKRAWLRKKW